MGTATKLLRAYRDQAGLDADDAIALLVSFLATYGMTDSAVAALCEYIDDEGMTEDFAGLLKENGLVVGPGGRVGEADGLGEEEME